MDVRFCEECGLYADVLSLICVAEGCFCIIFELLVSRELRIGRETGCGKDFLFSLLFLFFFFVYGTLDGDFSYEHNVTNHIYFTAEFMSHVY